MALAEGRQLEELASLLEAEGALPLRYPMLRILDAPDPQPVQAWLTLLVAGSFDLVILMTGEAVRRLLGFADRAGLHEAFVTALGRTRTLCRGPKPGQALRDLGLQPTLVARAPTTEGVLQSLVEEDLRAKTVGVTLYGSDNPRLVSFLQAAGAQVHTVLPYVYAPATDDERLVELIQKLDQGEVEVIVFTSSPQVERLFEVAQQRGLQGQLQHGWQRTRVAAVGPLVAEQLQQRGAPVHICPEQGWVMKNLVRQIVRAVCD